MASPTINITSYSRSIIGAAVGLDESIVNFEYDQNLDQWEARAGGTGIGQGLLVGSGANEVTLRLNQISGSLNTVQNDYTDLYSMSWGESSFTVENEELTQGDKTYRINVYGQNQEGEWNSYVG